mmetsp:Transcript_11427/g.26846  ORF Transcript_11427/g.26846 Transcript_11427/m.26846 type:complete len:111 (-) Transcript_11427:456-788(-)
MFSAPPRLGDVGATGDADSWAAVAAAVPAVAVEEALFSATLGRCDLPDIIVLEAALLLFFVVGPEEQEVARDLDGGLGSGIVAVGALRGEEAFLLLVFGAADIDAMWEVM